MPTRLSGSPGLQANAGKNTESFSVFNMRKLVCYCVHAGLL